jgi:catalase (peroxidase I)
VLKAKILASGLSISQLIFTVGPMERGFPEKNDVESFAQLEPRADGFRNYRSNLIRLR